MEEKTIRLVQDSFRRLVPIADQVGEVFYARLFATHPAVRPMFAEDASPQAKKLILMLSMVVNGLDKLDTIMPAVRQLAQRHRGYGVVDAHYEAVGETLLWTLRHGLAEHYTAEVEAAWTEAYGLLSGAMITATHEGVAP